MSKTITNHRGVKSCETNDNGYFVTLKVGWGFNGQQGLNAAHVNTVNDFKNSLPHDYGDLRGTDTKELLERGLTGQSKAMIEFGYPDATVDIIREHHTLWKSGGRDDRDVLFLFNERAFKEHTQFFGTQVKLEEVS